MKFTWVLPSLAATCVLLTGCTNTSSSGNSLGIPALLPIVRDAAPSGMKGSRGKLERASGCFSSGGTKSDIFTCLKDRVLSASPVDGPTATQWYLKYVKEVDERVSAITASGAACESQTAIDVPLDLSGGITNMGEETFPLQCVYTYTAMPTGWTGSFAYGVSGETITLVSRMVSTDGSYTVLAGSVNKEGTEAKIWFFGAYVSASEIKNLVVRLQANKTTGAFAYNWAAPNAANDDNNALDFCDFYLRTDSSAALRIVARPGLASSQACSTVSTFDFDSGTGGTQAACVTPADLDVDAASGACDALATFPTGGPGNLQVFDSTHVDATALTTAITDFAELDLTTLGVGGGI